MNDLRFEAVQLTNAELEIIRIEYANKRKLKSLCISHIAENIVEIVHDYYCSTLKRKLRSQPTSADIRNSPFEDLPCSVLNELYVECVKTYKGNPPSFLSEIFITQNKYCIKFEKNIFWTLEKRLLSVIAYKCQNLRQLILAECKIDIKIINDALKGLKNLHMLDLSGTSANNLTLQIISSNMNLLRELNLSNTKNVIEIGLKTLCERKLENLRILKLTNSLRNYGKMVTTLYDVLESYPELLVLEHESILDVLLLWKKYHPRELTKFTTLDVSVTQVKQVNDFNSVVSLCLNLIHISLSANCSFDGYKFILDSLRLRSISLNCLKPWFSSRFITKISLKATRVNMTELFSSFPNINDLSLDSCVLTYTPDKYDLHSIKNIKTFYLKNCQFLDCVVTIKDIFYSENLATLTILNCKYANAFVLNTPIRTTHFKSLTTNCLLTDWIQEIMQYNRKLESVTIKDLSTIRDYYNTIYFYDTDILAINNYFQEILMGKLQLFRPVVGYCLPGYNSYVTNVFCRHG